ncbi:MAG: fibronectin type III domain-containing protein [Nitrospiraceae bacterium]|nr:MAG: fibronectin type III domain-containing protein [Nitrospiraceae bacterium]
MAHDWFCSCSTKKGNRDVSNFIKKSGARLKDFVVPALVWGVPFFLSLLFLCPKAFTAEVSLNWKAPLMNEDGTLLKDLQGYIIYFGEQTGQYDGSVDVGMVTNYRMANLAAGRTYYFSVTAYDRSGNESRFSNEAGTMIPYGSSSVVDRDSDGIPDDGDGSGIVGDNPCSVGRLADCDDNCALTANPFQQDTDNDGYGNACDCDLDNDNIVSTSDYNLLYAAMDSDPSSSSWNRNADFDSDGLIGTKDYMIFSQRWMTQAPWD